jgi:hypothetical protein
LTIAEITPEPVEHTESQQGRTEELGYEGPAFIEGHIVKAGQPGRHEDESQRKDEGENGSKRGDILYVMAYLLSMRYNACRRWKLRQQRKRFAVTIRSALSYLHPPVPVIYCLLHGCPSSIASKAGFDPALALG